MDRLLRIDEAADALGVGRTRVYEWIAAKELRAVGIGRRGLRVPASEIDRFIADRMAEPAAA